MGMILGIAGLAVAAVKIYNRMRERSEQHLSSTTRTLRQGTGVVLAITRAVDAVLDALALIAPRPALQAAGSNGIRVEPRAAFARSAGEAESA